VGHEGPGSLLSLLKEKNWVSNLSSGERSPAKGFAMFSVAMELTEEGLDHVEEIVTHIFQVLYLLFLS